MHTDLLIHCRWLLPVEPAGTLLERQALAVTQGRITAILPSAQAREQIQAEQVVELPHHILLPGLINAHTHAAMSLFRGMADDLPLMQWLQQHIWPAEQQWVGPEFVRHGSLLAIAEMIRSGTTCFNDMYFFPDMTGQVALDTGIRAVLGMILIDFPSNWAQDRAEYLQKALQLHDDFRHASRITAIFAPHAPYSVNDEALTKVRTLAHELDLPIHMHVHETKDEIQASEQQYGMRPLQRLEHLQLLGPDLLAVHMTQLEDQEIASFTASGAHVVHCPESNLKLASGFCPVQKLLEAGVNVALGTDGAASNNDLDMLGEMRTAALLAKGISGDPTALPAAQALEMATLNGARALGLDGQTGSLVVGKSADMIAVDLQQVNTQPVFDPVSHLVYAASREQITHSWVEGRALMQNRRLLTLDEAAVMRQAEHWKTAFMEPSQ